MLMTSNPHTHYKLNMPVKIFIFEDSWMYLEALISVLGRENDIEVVGAETDVEPGLEKAIQVRPDIVLLDLFFNKENVGLQAAAELRGRLPETKVIIYSEHLDEKNIFAALDLGVAGYLLKSDVQEPNILLRAVSTVHQGGEYFTPSIKGKIRDRFQDKRKLNLSGREIEVLEWIAQGLSNRDIALTLKIDERTVANHVANILSKLYAKNRTEAVAIGKREKVID
jgi:DNA-binding NarL/FixJ family response regulator